LGCARLAAMAARISWTSRSGCLVMA
jgi:hypothetical protein